MMTDLEEMERCQGPVDQANYVKAMDHVVLVSISLQVYFMYYPDY